MKELAAALIALSVPFAIGGVFKKHLRVTLFTVAGLIFMSGWAILEMVF